MDQQAFKQLQTLFERARALAPEARAAYLDSACSDGDLREQVEALLDRHDRHGVLDEPIKPADAPPEPVPERIGRFHVIECIGRGAMGVVYRARQVQPRREVALKMMHAGLVSPALRRRFEFETSVLARLQHPNIAQIYEATTGEDRADARPFFVMELVDGVSLDRFVEQQDPSVDARLRLFVAICDGVQHAHQKGVIHRDLKPGNILVTPDVSPKILDFGVARATDADLQVTLNTTPGQLVGTLAYMSPEQVNLATETLDTRSDVYALGVILYELLAGQLPYDLGEGGIASAVRVIEEVEPPALTTFSRSLRGDLETIVRKALQKHPGDRYQSASDLAADIKRYLASEPILARPATAWYQFSRFARRHRGFVAGVFGIVLALILGGVGMAWQASRARAEARTRQEVADFLREMLTSIDPAKTAGKALTVRELLDDAVTGLDARFEHARGVRGELHFTVGSTYFLLGEFMEAERHLHSAVADLEVGRGPESGVTLRAVATLGLALSELDQLDKAEALLRDGLRRDPAHDDPTTDMLRENLAIVLDNQGKNEEAERLFRAVYERTRDRSGPDSIDTLRAQNNLGSVLLELGRNDEALPHAMECLERRRAVLGEDHPHTLTSMANLAAIYANMGRIDDATPLMEEAAVRSERVLGPVHLSTLRRAHNLIRVALGRGDFAAAVARARSLLDVSDRELGPSHRETLSALELMVTAVALGGDMDGAEAVALAWYRRLESDLGAKHHATGRVALLLQNLYDEMGDGEQEAVWKKRVEESSFGR